MERYRNTASFVDNTTGSSHAAHLLMKQQQQKQQCGPASRSEMESLIAELVASITAASFTNSDADRSVVDVHVMTTACAALDRLTIIGCSCISAVSVCSFSHVVPGGSFCAGRMASLLMQVTSECFRMSIKNALQPK